MLESRRPLRKEIRLLERGFETVTPYPKERFFKRHISREISNIHELASFINKLSASPTFALVHGEPLNALPMNQRVRRLYHSRDDYPATLGDRMQSLLILDIDGLPIRPVDMNREPRRAINQALKKLGSPFAQTSCYYQLTSSQQPHADRLYARLFFVLDSEVSLQTIKRWAETRKTDCCLDPALYSPAQLIYTAPPLFFGSSDPLIRRSGLVLSQKNTLPTDIIRSVSRVSVNKPRPPHGYGGKRLDYSNACFTDTPRGRDWLDKIGDHAGGDGFYRAIRSLIASAARLRGSKNNWQELKQIIRQRVWQVGPSVREHRYLVQITSDTSLDNLIAGAMRKFARF